MTSGDASAIPAARTALDRSLAGPVAAVAALAVVHLLVAAHTDLTDDEAYYRLWALAPAMSYLDHPPMVAWMIAAGRWLAGDTSLGVRLPAVLISALGPLVLWRTADNLFGPTVARRAVWFALAMPLLAVGGVIITPDTPSVLFWGLAVWALAELHGSRNANWWLVVGVFAGLGLLSKYTNLFLGAGILLWLIGSPANARWFLSWQLWLGGAIAIVLALPVLLWNADHEWASVIKQFGRAGGGLGWTLKYLAELCAAFTGLAGPLIAALAMAGLARATCTAARTRDPAHTLLVASLLPLAAYLLVHALHSRVQGNWPAPLYPAFAMCAALASRPGDPRWLRGLGDAGIVTGFVVSGLIFAHALGPSMLPGHLKDPTAQMRGWTEFAAAIDRLRTENGACSIATSSYATTAQLAYHLKDRAPVYQLTEPLRYVHLPPIDAATAACPALYVEIEQRQAVASLRDRFADVRSLDDLDRVQSGRSLGRYRVLVVRAARP